MVQSFPTQTPILPPPQNTRRLEIHVHLDIVSRANLVGAGFAKEKPASVSFRFANIKSCLLIMGWLTRQLFFCYFLLKKMAIYFFSRFFAGSGRRRRGEWRAAKQHHHRWLDV